MLRNLGRGGDNIGREIDISSVVAGSEIGFNLLLWHYNCRTLNLSFLFKFK